MCVVGSANSYFVSCGWWQGRTALHRCAEEDKLQEVQLIIAGGARIEALDLEV